MFALASIKKVIVHGTYTNHIIYFGKGKHSFDPAGAFAVFRPQDHTYQMEYLSSSLKRAFSG